LHHTTKIEKTINFLRTVVSAELIHKVAFALGFTFVFIDMTSGHGIKVY